jgi:hypothetical protein
MSKCSFLEHRMLTAFLLVCVQFKLCNGRSVQFDVGNVVMVTRNTGCVGVIKNWEKHKGIFEVIDVLLGAFCMLCLVFSYLLYRKT